MTEPLTHFMGDGGCTWQFETQANVKKLEGGGGWHQNGHTGVLHPKNMDIALICVQVKCGGDTLFTYILYI